MANPFATILSLAMMLRYTLNLPKEAQAIEAAVKTVLASGYRTVDIMSPGKTSIGTEEAGNKVVNSLK